MEIALPLLALGGLFVISNQNTEKDCDKTQKKITKETFTNMGKQVNYLPNTNIPPQNYPIMNTKQLIDTVQEYVNPNASTDKYFNQNYFENQENSDVRVGNNPQQIYSLNGNYINSKAFKHNNMVPFDGGKIKGYTYDVQIAESILDNMAGTGSQVIKKVEQSPLFKPEENMSWAYGMPNQSDFFQSRVNPGTRNNNVKPFDSVTVAPGLNQGYTTEGSGGFNSGMEYRDKWLPKTIDELRVDTNPKIEYSLTNHEGPSYSYIQNRGIIGRVEKQLPDTFFIQNQDRWLTTTGSEKAQMIRPIQEMGIIRKNIVDSNYHGPAAPAEKVAGYVPTAFEDSKRQKTETTDIPLANAVGHGPEQYNDTIKSFTNYNNNRSTVKSVDTMRSGFSSAIGAVIAPLMDILRPSKKEEVTNNIRIYGDAGSSVTSNYILNPNDVTQTTIKETTVYSPQFYINNQKEGHYVNTYKPTDETQRDTSSTDYIGGVGNNYEGPRNNEAEYRQHNNDIKSSTIFNHANMGGMQTFNSEINMSIARQDSDRLNNRLFTPSSVIATPPAKQMTGYMIPPQQYNLEIQLERNTPDILDAFRQNPYTQSLTNSV